MTLSKQPLWNSQTRSFLKDNYWKLSVKELAETLGTTQASIRGQMFRMGLYRGNVETERAAQLAAPGWNPTKEAYLMANYQTQTFKSIGQILNYSESHLSLLLRGKGFRKGPERIGTEELLTRIRSFRTEFGHYPRIDGGSAWKPEHLEGCKRHGIPDQSTIRRRFNGCLTEAWAAAEGKPVTHINVNGRHLTPKFCIDVLNVYRHLTGSYPTSFQKKKTWNNSWLTSRLGMPIPSRYRGAPFNGLLEAREQAAKHKLNKTLLDSYNLTPEEMRQAAVGSTRQAA